MSQSILTKYCGILFLGSLLGTFALPDDMTNEYNRSKRDILGGVLITSGGALMIKGMEEIERRSKTGKSSSQPS